MCVCEGFFVDLSGGEGAGKEEETQNHGTTALLPLNGDSVCELPVCRACSVARQLASRMMCLFCFPFSKRKLPPGKPRLLL